MDGRIVPTRRLLPPRPIDLRLTLGPLRHGAADRTMRFAGDGSVWRATWTPDGPATERLVAVGPALRVETWGPGADWLLGHAAELVGMDDDPAGFAPAHPLLRALVVRLAGLRIPRTRAVLEALVPAVCSQKVTGDEARRAIDGLVARYGQPAPGPWPAERALVRLPPAASTLAGLPSYDLHQVGLERRRAETIRRAASRAVRLEALAMLPLAEARERLEVLPGIGPWTAAEVAVTAFGDADAVSLGDFHLPSTVAWALAREPRGDDARMLELLEPYRGHRARVIRLIESAGIRAPRYGPRMAPRRIVDA